MPNPELLTFQEIQPVTRSFLITIASPEEIFALFQNPSDKGEIPSILRFILAVKTSPEKGGERLTLPGGKIGAHENYLEAAQREIVEELGGILIPIGHTDARFKKTLHFLGDFSYTFQRTTRRAFLNAFYIDPNSLLFIGDQKICEFRTISLEELKALINGEDIEGLKLEEHLRKGVSHNDFVIDPEENKKREEYFKQALNWFTHIDHYLKRRFAKIFQENPNLTLEEFTEIYRREIIRFKRLGLERTLPKKKDKKEPEETPTRLVKVIERGLNSEFLGNDVLYFLPSIAELIAEEKNPETYLEESTKNTLSFYRYFREAYDEFVALTHYSIETLETLEQVHGVISIFNAFIRERLKKDFGLSDEDINLTFSHFDNFWEELEHEIKIADPQLTEGLIQSYRLLNEVATASFGRLVLLFLGKDQALQKNIDKGAKKKLIFEAGRQLLFLMKGFLSTRIFNERSNPESMQLVNMAIESFFGSLTGEEIKIDLGKGGTIIQIRETTEGERFIVDKKPKKSWRSFFRKSFKEKPVDIVDFSSYSIVYLGKDKDKFIEELTNGKFEEEFLNFLQQRFPGKQIHLQSKSTFGLENYTQGKKEVAGKRTGSQAKRIVAKKYILKIDDQVAELVIYPYLSTQEAGIDDNGWWLGWKEKRQDDANYVVRRMLGGENGFPSFYDLLFPPNIYPELYKQRLRATYHL